MGEEGEPKRRFPAFPFDPYPIQTDFMNFLYDSLDNGGGIAMLESPTGTGKTLSIICSALQWIVDRRSRNLTHPPSSKPDPSSGQDEEPAWMRDFVGAAPERRKTKTKKKEIQKTKSGLAFGDPENNNPNMNPKGQESINKESALDREDDSEFLLEDYESEEEGGLKRKGRKCSGCGSSEEEDGEEKSGFFEGQEEEEDEKTPKLFFSSRTHSQLSQFVKEFRRTAFAQELNLVCLGSRKNMCINPEVLKLGNSSRINERCLELQKNRKDSRAKVQTDGMRGHHKKASSGCPMLRKQNLQDHFKNKAWEHEALDIEDLVQVGNKLGTCPYYGSRNMVKEADIVVLPYQSLLLRSARESLGLKLKNNVIVIDEAHNLADSITSMYNSKISLSQLKQVLSHLESYLVRFRSHLGAGNRRYIQTLMALTKSFLQLLLGCRDDTCAATLCRPQQVHGQKEYCDVSMTINEFVFSLDIDNINLVKLHRYVKETNIIHKISGYAMKLMSSHNVVMDNDSQSHAAEGSIVSGFQALLDILISLINNDSEGRIIVSREKLPCSVQIEEGHIKFIMLSGERIFSEIMNQAYAIVLAGGTLQPIEETRVRLFPGVSLEQVHFFTCKHIVPPESILPIAISRGPSGKAFDFSYNSRSSPSMIEELGRLLSNLVAVVPEGIVVFFSSFDYEQLVYDTWKSSGVLPRILKKKRVFREPRSNNNVEHVLKEYKETISSSSGTRKEDPGPNGALLLAVVGGKISEGINFSDGMGRCVIMVGLPYPSPSDIELLERIKHIERLGESISYSPSEPCSTLSRSTAGQTGFEILRSCKRRGREYYDNLCMKAVNQSIGRAIRHVNDYASVLLVDSRYSYNMSNPSVSRPIEKLPLWIKERLVSVTGGYGEVHKLLHQFFQFNKQKRMHIEVWAQ